MPLIFSSADPWMTSEALRGPVDLWLDRPTDSDQVVALFRFLLGTPTEPTEVRDGAGEA